VHLRRIHYLPPRFAEAFGNMKEGEIDAYHW